MRRFASAAALTRGAACVALALLSYFQFPGHTWLQQDSQIYAPILEHLRDPSVLRNDLLVQQPHVAFTVYDEVTLGLRAVTGASFHTVLAGQQIAARTLGIWGLLLMAETAGLAFWPALLVAAICSLGAAIPGPAVLTVEYEPSPRAFALPLLICAAGLAVRGRHWAAGVAGGVAVLYHAPTALPFCSVYAAMMVWPKPGREARWRALGPLAAASALLLVCARWQSGAGEPQQFFAHLDAAQVALQRLRTAYVWVSAWPAENLWHHALLLVIFVAAMARIREALGTELRLMLAGMAAVGVLSVPLSWLLLEQAKWGLIPQLQPMRALLFVTLGVQFLTAAAGARALVERRMAEAFAWFVLAYMLPMQPLATGPFDGIRLAVALVLAGATVMLRARVAPAAALVAFFAIPLVGGVVNYPDLHTADLAELSAWARENTPKDAVFLFPDVNKGLAPGIFRSEALRAVYVDWKGGGQVNYLKDLGEQWWFRWQQTRRFQAGDLPRYGAIGITYVVLREPLARAAAHQNQTYAVYAVR